ncbi:MAG: hypothetical protein IT210_11895 [Armatimonadetes bacterium]|nr:hypothetical protein [Armatimonadota bacterium]
MTVVAETRRRMTQAERQARRQRALEGLERGAYRIELECDELLWVVRQEGGQDTRKYRIEWSAERKRCYCPEANGEAVTCKHLFMAWFALERGTYVDVRTRPVKRPAGQKTIALPLKTFWGLYLVTQREPEEVRAVLGGLTEFVQIGELEPMNGYPSPAVWPYYIRSSRLDPDEKEEVYRALGVEG